MNDIESFIKAREIVSKIRTARFELETAILEKPWLEYLRSLFKQNGYPCSVKPKNNKALLNTVYSFQLEKVRQKWYPKIRKCVPRDLVITPRVMLHWFIGDGACHGREITFSTEGFPRSGVEFLASLISEELKIHAKCRPKKKSRPDQCVIGISVPKYGNRFFAYLANDSGFDLARKIFPWKFDPELLKRDCV
jgi:hypothetical protein